MSALIGGLAVNGTLLVVGASEDPIEVLPFQLLFGRRRIQGWSAGIPNRFGGHAALCRNDRRAPHDRKSARKAAEGYHRELKRLLTM